MVSGQVGSGLKPFSTSLLLSRRELNGHTALDKPYSSVVTGGDLSVKFLSNNLGMSVPKLFESNLFYLT